MNYHATAQNGRLNMGSDFTREAFRKFLLKHEGARVAFVPVVPESKNQRGMFEGAYIPLWIWLDGKDHRNHEVHDEYHELAKLEFNSAMGIVGGRTVKYGKSTKGKKALTETMHRMLDFLVENYGIDPLQVLNPKDYKHWRDTIFPFGGSETYIDYLVETGKLKKL